MSPSGASPFPKHGEPEAPPIAPTRLIEQEAFDAVPAQPSTLPAPEAPVPWDEAKNYLDQVITVKGTIVDEILDHGALEKKFVRLGHPGGVIEVGASLKRKGVDTVYSEAILGRTARRLMEGYVLVPEKYFKPL